MKNLVYLIALFCLFIGTPSLAAPGGPHGGHGPAMGNRPAIHAGVSMGHRPPMVNRPPMGGMHRPPHHVGVRPLPPPSMYRHYRPFVRPYYYSTVYYPVPTYTTYSYQAYEPVVPVASNVETVVVRDNYAGINTAANVINAAANVAATIRYLNW